MKTLRCAILLGTASLLLSARVVPAQATAAASSARPVPDLATRQTPPRDARILSSHGQIQVIANDSSLNVTLLQIAAATGIRVSGVAAEERIFGTYGPSTPAALFRALLQGTGTNMLLTQSSANAPAELVLTSQNGPVSPPSIPSAPDRQVPPRVASAAPAQPGANLSPADHGAGQSEPEASAAQPPPASVPLTSGERALLVDRIQQQQRQAARQQ